MAGSLRPSVRGTRVSDPRAPRRPSPVLACYSWSEMTSPQYTFGIPNAATDVARRDALGQTAGGMIRVAAQHWLAKALQPELLTRQGDGYEMTYHAIEFILCPAIAELGEGFAKLTWYIKPIRLSSLLKDL